MSLNDWISFFSKAGISPPSAVKTYAAVFVKNKIGNDTLEDLEKEGLHDMGITAIGDIYRILKHAKKIVETKAKVVEVKEEDINEEVLSDEDNDEVMARVEADIPKWRSEENKVKREVPGGGHKAVARPSLYDRNKVTRKRALMKQEMKPEAEKAANSSKEVKPMTKPRIVTGNVCQICEKSFSSKGNMKTHVKTVHDMIRDWQCDKCPYAASNKGNLKIHKRRMH